MDDPVKLQRPRTLTEAVIAHIQDVIIAGRYRPGEPLSEVRLATEFGTSRGTVREALRALADDGLVDIFPHRGSFVSSITAQKVKELYQLRERLEPFAVRLGIENGILRDERHLERVKATLAQLGQAADERRTPELIEAERELHRLLWSFSGNELLTETVRSLYVQTRRVLAYTRAFELGDDQYEHHHELVSQILTGDADAAEQAVASHLRASCDVMLERMREIEASDLIGRSEKVPEA